MTLFVGATGLGVGLIVSSLLLGLRHGVDWDHIAAITDIAATQESPRRGFTLGLTYAFGHSLVVLAIGIVVIAVGRSVPDSVDAMFGRIVGWTLIVLGLYLLYSLAVHRGRFRMRSRWMLVISGVRKLVARFRRGYEIKHEHEHAVFDVHHSSDDDDHADPGVAPVHSHRHTHSPDAGFGEYGRSVSFGVGMLHGVGAETPTQVVTFLAASRAGGTPAGITVLVVFLVGLVIANAIISWLFSYGFQAGDRRQSVQMALGAVTAVASLIVGVLFALGQDAVLPAFFGG